MARSIRIAVAFLACLPVGVHAATSLDSLARECTSGKAKSCDRLARIATSGKTPAIRIAAIGRVTDSAVLADIFRHESDPAIRGAAGDQIRDPAVVDSLVSVRVLSAVRSPQLLIPRDRTRPGADGKPEPVFGSMYPPRGSVMLSLELAIQTPQPFKLSMSQITLRPALADPQAQLSGVLIWAKPLRAGLLSERIDRTIPEVGAFWTAALSGTPWLRFADSLTMDDGTILDVAMPAPAANPEKQTLWFGSISLGSLGSLGYPQD